VITNSVAVSAELGGRNDNKVFLSGGELDYQYKAFFDHRSCDYLAEFTPSLAVLSVGAISRDQGLMDFHSGEAAVNRIVYGKARTVILAADASKFDRYGLIRTAHLTDVDVLVTDLPPSAGICGKLHSCAGRDRLIGVGRVAPAWPLRELS
jgi:DeoR family glycerol-3-phosphate regulon repressor